jgi:hypothetical protein
VASTSDQICDIQSKRFAYLKFVYDDAQRVRAGTIQTVDADVIHRALGVSDDEGSRIGDYLEERRLIRYITMGPIVTITAHGIDYVEAALAELDRPTEHFQPINVLHIDQLVNSQIQQGTVQSTQHAEWSGISGGELRSLLAELKPLFDQPMSNEQNDDLNANFQTLEAQAKAPRPNKVIVREALSSLRSIAEKVGASLIAVKIAEMLAGVGAAAGL